MNKIVLVTILGSWLLGLSGSAVGGQSIQYSETITFPDCEFRVHFPTKTQQKIAYANGAQSLMVQSIYDGESPFMRAVWGGDNNET